LPVVDSGTEVIQPPCQLRQFLPTPRKEVPVKYIPRIAASAALVVVAFAVVTFAQIKFAPQSAENNPLAQIVLNVESQLNG
jgi:hypothetical protein